MATRVAPVIPVVMDAATYPPPAPLAHPAFVTRLVPDGYRRERAGRGQVAVPDRISTRGSLAVSDDPGGINHGRVVEQVKTDATFLAARSSPIPV